MRALTLALAVVAAAGCRSRLVGGGDPGAADLAPAPADLSPSLYRRVTTRLDDCQVMALARGDLDGDGHDDLAVVCRRGDGTTDTRLLAGRGDATFAVARTFAVDSAAVVIADVDADGAPDLVVGGQHLVVLRNGGGWTATTTDWPSPYAGAAGASFATLAVADFDEDGKLDVASAYLQPKPGPSRAPVPLMLGWALGDGKGGFGPPAAVATSDASAVGITARDLDGDGHADVAYGTSQPFAVVYKGDGHGGLQRLTAVDVPDATVAALRAAGDLDGDGLAELVVARGRGLSAIYDHGGLAARRLDDSDATAAAIGDLDGDGRTDLALRDDHFVRILTQPGGYFAPPVAVANFYGGAGVAIGDEDGDGSNDIVVGGNDEVDVLLRRP